MPGDARQALRHGADPATVHYDLALVHRARQDRAAALASVEEALRHNPTYSDALRLRDDLRRPE